MNATETTDDVKTIRPPRLGRTPAFAAGGYSTGVSERTYIATAAMQGLLTLSDDIVAASVAGDAVRFADALLAELAK